MKKFILYRYGFCLSQVVQVRFFVCQVVQVGFFLCQVVQLEFFMCQVWQVVEYRTWYMPSWNLKYKCVSTVHLIRQNISIFPRSRLQRSPQYIICLLSGRWDKKQTFVSPCICTVYEETIRWASRASSTRHYSTFFKLRSHFGFFKTRTSQNIEFCACLLIMSSRERAPKMVFVRPYDSRYVSFSVFTAYHDHYGTL